MKKTLLIFSIFSLLVSFSSCKKYDDDIDDLQRQIDDLNNQQSGTNSLLQTGQPITVSFTGNRGYDSTAYSYSSVYNFSWDDPVDANYVTNNGDGTYDFYIDRYSLVEGSNEAYINISGYDPAMGISNANIHVYAENYFQQSDTSATLYVQQDGYLNSSGTDNITVNSFSYDISSRVFNINLTVNSTEANPYNSANNPAKVTFTFSGTLTNSNIVYRKGVQ